MPPEHVDILLSELRALGAEVKGFKELMNERFDRNDAEHQILKEEQKAIKEYQKIQNGNVARLVEFKNNQETSNKWMYGICTLILIPVIFLIIKQFV